MKKVINSAWTSAVMLVSYAVPVFAENPPGSQKIDVSTGVPGNLATLTVPKVISGVINLTVVAAAVIFFFWLILGGIQWIVSGGDKQKTEAARGQITGALVGLVIVFSAWAIAQLIKTLFNIDLFNLTITSF